MARSGKGALPQDSHSWMAINKTFRKKERARARDGVNTWRAGSLVRTLAGDTHVQPHLKRIAFWQERIIVDSRGNVQV